MIKKGKLPVSEDLKVVLGTKGDVRFRYGTICSIVQWIAVLLFIISVMIMKVMEIRHQILLQHLMVQNSTSAAGAGFRQKKDFSIWATDPAYLAL
jgi:hypothetical protein